MENLKQDHDNHKEMLHQLMMNKDNANAKASYPEASKLNEEIQRL